MTEYMDFTEPTINEETEEETFPTPCGSMTSEEIREHIEECEVCAAEHADTPLDLF